MCNDSLVATCDGTNNCDGGDTYVVTKAAATLRCAHDDESLQRRQVVTATTTPRVSYQYYEASPDDYPVSTVAIPNASAAIVLNHQRCELLSRPYRHACARQARTWCWRRTAWVRSQTR